MMRHIRWRDKEYVAGFKAGKFIGICQLRGPEKYRKVVMKMDFREIRLREWRWMYKLEIVRDIERMCFEEDTLCEPKLKR
jgi:hypothetical protein